MSEANKIPKERLIQAASKLPAGPQILARLGKMVSSMDSDIDEISDLLRRDAALTAKIIRVSNSVMYSNGSVFDSLESALSRIGITEAYRITGMSAAASLADTSLRNYDVSGVRLRENSLLTALIAEELAKHTGIESRSAYTAGLLRSIGKFVVDRLVTASLQPDKKIGATVAEPNWPLSEWEIKLAGVSSCEAAAIILEEWRFPKSTVEAVRWQYEPEQHGLLPVLLNIAGTAVDMCGHHLPAEFGYWGLTNEKLSASGLSRDQVDSAMRAGLEKFGPVRSALA